MPIIKVEIKSGKNAKKFADFAKNLKYVKSVAFEDEAETAPLSNDDWVKPGRPATPEEIDARIDECEKDFNEGRIFSSNSLDSHVAERLAENGYKI